MLLQSENTVEHFIGNNTLPSLISREPASPRINIVFTNFSRPCQLDDNICIPGSHCQGPLHDLDDDVGIPGPSALIQFHYSLESASILGPSVSIRRGRVEFKAAASYSTRTSVQRTLLLKIPEHVDRNGNHSISQLILDNFSFKS